MFYGRPFLFNLMIVPEPVHFLMYIICLGPFQQAFLKLGKMVLPTPKKGGELKIVLGEQVLIKSWKEGTPADQLYPECKCSYQVILTIPTVIKVKLMDGWIHFSKVKYVMEELFSDKVWPEDTYSYKHIEDPSLPKGSKSSAYKKVKALHAYFFYLLLTAQGPCAKDSHSWKHS
jgi:hypothetical protein